MLTDDELAELFERLRIPAAGREYIRRVRADPPSRATSTNKCSGKLRYTPLKMPFVVEAEAESTEYVALVDMDHDDATLEFYGQPDALKISYLLADGRRNTSVHTTPDYLRITADRVVFIECKREEELQRLAKKMPGRYQREADGTWRSRPAEATAQALGCSFEIRSSAQNNWARHENLELLKDYFLQQHSSTRSASTAGLLDRLAKQSRLRLFDLIHLEPSIPADAIYLAIARRQVFFPIDSQRLTDQERAYVYRDETAFTAFQTFLPCATPAIALPALSVELAPETRFLWDGVPWKIVNAGETKFTVRCLDTKAQDQLGELSPNEFDALVRARKILIVAANESLCAVDLGVELLKNASKSELQEAIWRLEVLQSRANIDNNPLAKRSTRAVKYWKAAFREAEALYGNGLAGLIPRRSGNRTPKASPRALTLAEEHIHANFETIRAKNRVTVWGHYCVAASAEGAPPVSYEWFCRMVKKHSGHAQTAARLGEKAAYDQEPHYLQLEWTTPRHGVRPWHIGHIDHTPIPLKFVHSELGKIVDTIWLTILVDGNTRKVLAYYLSFDEPSYRSCMMVIRDCVRRHGRVHQMLVVDQGSEFKSIYFEKLVASLGIDKRERRAGKPREGSVCERIFNTSQEQFIKRLMGSTEVVENYFRRVSPEVEPTRHAVWTMDRFDEGFQAYLDEVYHVNHHTGLDMSPNEAWALGLRSHGERKHRAMPYDDNFLMASCPEVHRGVAKVCTAGIKVNYRWFKSPVFNQPGVQGTSVPARYDPFNCGVAYAFVNGTWHACYSEHFAVFSTLTERAVQRATEQIRLTDRISGRKARLNATRIAAFLSERELEEDVARQARNDLEAQNHRAKLTDSRQQTPPDPKPGPVPAPDCKSTSAFQPRVLEDL